jgi:hypothetical protein
MKRVELIREAGVTVSASDEKKVTATVAAALGSLNQAVSGSLFDTEPQTFDIELRRLRRSADEAHR